MSFALLLPTALAALAALLLPLLIHLARRSEQRVLDFAALRWLGNKARPQRKRRFEDWPLLLVRLLLLAALALLLAMPVLYGRPDRTPWIVAVPGVAAPDVLDIAGDDDARLRWLAPGFPPIDQTATNAAPQPVASLLRELDATLPAGAPLTILAPPVFDGADAQRPRLTRRVDWRIVSSAPPGARAINTQVPMTLAVRHMPEREAALRYLRAAGVAWRTAKNADQESAANPGNDQSRQQNVSIASATTPIDAGTQHLVWLAPGPLPREVRDWITSGGVALVDAKTEAPELASAVPLWRADEGTPRVTATPLGRGSLLQLQQPMTPSAMPELLDATFPQRLRALFDAPLPSPSRADANAYAPTTGTRPYPETPRPLAPWLLVLIALLFGVERWLASGRRRGAVG